MKIAAFTITNQPTHPGLAKLKASAERHGYDLTVTEAPWRGYGGKILHSAEFASSVQDTHTHILFMDAHDTYFLRSCSELEKKVIAPHQFIASAEKACWPDADRAKDYHYATPPSPWCYLNSGQYLTPIPLLLRIVEENPIQEREDDQRWMTSVFLSGKYDMRVDMNCRIFQSIAFPEKSDFRTDEKGLYNTVTRTRPFAAHGNGRTPMQWIYEL